MPETTDTSADVLTVVPGKAPLLMLGIGLVVATLLFIYLSAWATRSARQQKAGADALCQQLRDQGDIRVETLALCREDRGKSMEGLGVLPGLLAVACGLGGGYALFLVATRKESYTFDRRRGVLLYNDREIAPLDTIQQVAVNRSGRSYVLEVLYQNGDRTGLSEYLTAEQPNQEAERIRAYLGLSKQSH